MNKNTLLKEPFWRLTVRFGIVFIIVVIIIQLIWEFFSTGNLNAITESFQNGNWITYAISKLVIGLVYGATMAFFTKRSAKRK